MEPNRARESRLTGDRVRQLLRYSAETGEFFWLVGRKGAARFGALAGKIRRDGYRYIGIDKGVFAAHRLAWLYVHGFWPVHVIDHINRARSDNRIANLRDVLPAQNVLNQTPRITRPRTLPASTKSGPWSRPLAIREAQLTATALRERINYDPETGLFRRPGADKQIGSVRATAGYRFIIIDGHPYAAHRLAWLYVHGRWPLAYIDHANGVRADNRLSNLREASPHQNNANRRARLDRPFKGITPKRKRWQAQIGYRGRNHYLGLFDTAAEANAAYAAAARMLFGEFARVA